jgi:primosomal protein N' (replication factor Y)
MVPLAFATQTGGSLVRPAAYCGVAGFKPTYNSINGAGIKLLAPSLDTVGVYGRDVPDAALFAADFRAPERLFATLMQVAGRAGRHHADSRVLIQTRFPEHAVYEALAAHDYVRFAEQQLAEREQAVLPPFVHQALLTAQARSAADAQAFLKTARHWLTQGGGAAVVPPDALAAVSVFDPVPMPLAQLRGESRAQMLIESASRPALHAVLGAWLAELHAQRASVRWQLVVDPLEI